MALSYLLNPQARPLAHLSGTLKAAVRILTLESGSYSFKAARSNPVYELATRALPLQRRCRRGCQFRSVEPKQPSSTRMTYQTQRADLRGQGRRGADFTTGAPQVHWRKKTSVSLQEELPRHSLLSENLSGAGLTSRNSTPPRASAGSGRATQPAAGESRPPWRGSLQAPRGTAAFGSATATEIRTGPANPVAGRSARAQTLPYGVRAAKPPQVVRSSLPIYTWGS